MFLIGKITISLFHYEIYLIYHGNKHSEDILLDINLLSLIYSLVQKLLDKTLTMWATIQSCWLNAQHSAFSVFLIKYFIAFVDIHVCKKRNHRYIFFIKSRYIFLSKALLSAKNMWTKWNTYFNSHWFTSTFWLLAL